MILVESKCAKARLLPERHNRLGNSALFQEMKAFGCFCSVPKASCVALTRKSDGVITIRRCVRSNFQITKDEVFRP
jgi:hypothetical protein